MAVHLQMSSGLDGTHGGEAPRERTSKKSTPQGKRGTKTAIWGPQLFFEQRAVEKQKRIDKNYVEKKVYKINVFIKNYAVC